MVNWGPAADAKLLYCILEAHNIKIDYGRVAILFGEDVTPKAITHRVAKLRADAKIMVGGRGKDVEGSKDEPSTPKKTTTRKKREGPEGQDGMGNDVTPSSKRSKKESKCTPSKNPASPKVQSSDDREGHVKVKDEWNDASEQLWREQTEAV